MNDIDNIRQYLAEKDAKRQASRKQPYRKPESIVQLERLHYEQAKAKNPDFHHVKAKFRDDSANSLTTCVISFLKLKGHQAERINTMGRPVDNTRVVTDFTGRRRRIGSVTWMPSGSTPGCADISATINGRSIKIEIKFGHDRQSEAQRKYQKSIENAGGIYIIARTFDQFKSWYDHFMTKV